MLKVFTGGQCLPLELIAITLFKPKTPKEAKCFEFTVQIGAPRGECKTKNLTAPRFISEYALVYIYFAFLSGCLFVSNKCRNG